MKRKMQYTKAQFEKAIEGSGGIITQIAKKVGCARQTAYNCIEKFELQNAVKAEAETILDLAETKLVQNINNNDNTAIIFYLKTKGKNRGYVERQEIKAELEAVDYKEKLELNEAEQKALQSVFERRALKE